MYIRRCAEVEDEAAQGRDRPIEALDILLEGSPNLRVGDLEGLALERETDGEEILDDGIVKIACDPLSILCDGEALQSLLKTHGSDGGAGDHGECFDERLVLLGEPALLVGEVEVAEQARPGSNRHTEERFHLRMVRWDTG